ncbi:MAG: cation-translocating P-type ATPase [Bacteroidetes bacterium]|nr:cation-translocating P-type ATPase [Bacteroidota bacterium]
MSENQFNIPGLSAAQVLEARTKFGTNTLQYKKENTFLIRVKNILLEPMVLMLLVAATIYFTSGKTSDGIFMLAAILFSAAISLYQDSRSKNALEKLKQFSQAKCKVYRDGKLIQIGSEELVVGDSLLVEEGTSITADGIIIQSNDFSVNESILTGESMPVFKDKSKDNNLIYKGTAVASGLAIATITAIGNLTKLGKIGKSLESIEEEKTPLELQISNFVKKMMMGGALVFAVVWGINYLHSRVFLDSLLRSLTLAMSIMPEEIPVAFTTFMALGAWRLMKMGVVVKQMKTVETLGSATVICTDKTGTLTENNMRLAKLFVWKSKTFTTPESMASASDKELLRIAMFASETIPFDPMEVELHAAYKNSAGTDERPHYKMIHEYALSGKPPMMTHIFGNDKDKKIIAAKGAPEALLTVCNLTEQQKQEIIDAIHVLAVEGYRILGVGEANFEGTSYPLKQEEFKFEFLGLVAFYDPPKHNIQKVLEDFYKAGIAVKIITGDNAATTISIAKQIGFKGFEKSISGDELMKLSDADLNEVVVNNNIFTRMFPEAKLKIITALKNHNEIVAMTGDGVNDGPALKAAHIGIAMGKKGTEIAKQAASLILLEDDLSKMVDAVAMGRKIYTNLKKAIQYIISIHIPIILTVFIPLALGWIYPNIFSPIHVIFLELIMGPTCSIIYENEPFEKNLMIQKPRPFTTTFFSWKELATSIVQGIVITVGTLFTYQYAVQTGCDEQATRTMVFITLISSNIFLTLINRSFYYSIFTTLLYKNNLVVLIICITVIISGLILYVKPLTVFFEFEVLPGTAVFLSAGVGFICVIWYECVKWWKRIYRAKI